MTDAELRAALRELRPLVERWDEHGDEAFDLTFEIMEGLRPLVQQA